jgi:hypothetical protein
MGLTLSGEHCSGRHACDVCTLVLANLSESAVRKSITRCEFAISDLGFGVAYGCRGQ